MLARGSPGSPTPAKPSAKPVCEAELCCLNAEKLQDSTVPLLAPSCLRKRPVRVGEQPPGPTAKNYVCAPRFEEKNNGISLGRPKSLPPRSNKQTALVQPQTRSLNSPTCDAHSTLTWLLKFQSHLLHGIPPPVSSSKFDIAGCPFCVTAELGWQAKALFVTRVTTKKHVNKKDEVETLRIRTGNKTVFTSALDRPCPTEVAHTPKNHVLVHFVIQFCPVSCFLFLKCNQCLQGNSA